MTAISAPPKSPHKLDADWVILSARVRGRKRFRIFGVPGSGVTQIRPKIGRAEALRRSMLSLIPTRKDTEDHPTFCAPFVLVWEGGAASNSGDHWSVLLASSDQRANLLQTNVDTVVRAAAPEGRIAAE